MTQTRGIAATESDEVLVRRDGALGHIRLNRPRALNSLTLDMVRAISGALDAFEADDRVAAVLVDGAGERGLCAGGDIRAIYDSARRRDGHAQRFLREEYALNARIASYPKPYVAIMDGITMGGGVGISAHGSHRVGTERTRFALPEVAIGFFPDVGATWLLPRAPGETGTWIALTGESLGPHDTIHAGLADVFVGSADLPAVHEGLAALAPSTTAADVSATLRRLSSPPEAGRLAGDRPAIDRLMAFADAAAIRRALENDGSAFAQGVLHAMAAASPTSLALTVRLLRLGRAAASLEDCLISEYRAACRALHGHDFLEGIRAAVIDKDRQPRWSPARLDDIGEGLIGEHLAPADGEETIFPGKG
ncbi:MAG TPA: enoyl-CoA hydratase/isomerase family protein [Beijerinckiaceae bacterium]|nr:enoyl-CoA hydratase/isomerase family protein [Beijerinckiaceae bacterium]